MISIGDIVWAKIDRKPWWPAIVSSIKSKKNITVKFLIKRNSAIVKIDTVKSFIEHYKEFKRPHKGTLLDKAMKEAKKIIEERKIKDDELTTRSNNESENKEKHPIETIKEIEEIKIPNEEVTYFKEKINYLLEFVLNKPEEEIKARSEEIRNIYKLLLFRKFPTLTFIRNSYLGIILKNVSESLESIEGLEKTAKLTRIVYERLRMHVMNEFFGESNEEIERMRNVKMAFKHIKKEKVIKPIDESKKDTAINKSVK